MTFAFLAFFLVAFLFSGIESALAAVDRLRLRKRALEGAPDAREIDRMLDRPGRLLATTAIVTTASKIAALALLYGLLAGRFSPQVAALLLFMGLPLMALLMEFFPKAFFRKSPYRKLRRFVGILRWADLLLSPISAAAQKFAPPLFETGAALERRRLAKVPEIRRLTNLAAEKGALSPLQKHLAHSVLNARETRARDLALPLRAFPCIAGSEKVPAVLDAVRRGSLPKPGGADAPLTRPAARKAPASAVVVLGEDGRPVGYLKILDLLLDGIASGNAQSYARRLATLDPDTPCPVALIKMRAARAPLALVAGEGETEPLVLSAETLVRNFLLGAKPPRNAKSLPDLPRSWRT